MEQIAAKFARQQKVLPTLPRTGHRVVSPEEARRREVRTIVIANATYVNEVAALCDAMGLRVELECVAHQAFARRT